MLGTEGFKRSADLLPLGKSLLISVKGLGLETNWKHVSKCSYGSCCCSLGEEILEKDLLMKLMRETIFSMSTHK